MATATSVVLRDVSAARARCTWRRATSVLSVQSRNCCNAAACAVCLGSRSPMSSTPTAAMRPTAWSGPRIVAALTALWLVVGGVLAGRHEAEVQHCTDLDGHSVHAPKMVGAHTSDTSDVHALDGAADHDVCAIELALHQAGNAASSNRPAIRAPHVRIVSEIVVEEATRSARPVFRLAPKTSPPARV